MKVSMATMYQLIPILKDMNACTESLCWLRQRKHRTFTEAYNDCPQGDWLLWLACQVPGYASYPLHDSSGARRSTRILLRALQVAPRGQRLYRALTTEYGRERQALTDFVEMGTPIPIALLEDGHKYPDPNGGPELYQLLYSASSRAYGDPSDAICVAADCGWGMNATISNRILADIVRDEVPAREVEITLLMAGRRNNLLRKVSPK